MTMRAFCKMNVGLNDEPCRERLEGKWKRREMLENQKDCPQKGKWIITSCFHVIFIFIS